MINIINQKIDFYTNITKGCKKYISIELNKEKIMILEGFIKNIELVHEFYQTYYGSRSSRVVLCGINPGRLGAGKTGVPFLDFKSLSNYLNSITSDDQEKSAQFINSIISYFGAKPFFNSFYLTNISWFGFFREGKNLNYYELSSHLQKEFTNGFISEMEIVQPTEIIPLSKKVEKSLKEMKKEGILKYRISKPLPHPYYCSMHIDDCTKKYIEKLQSRVLTC